ncbi:unnamed protein product [Lupinus luteus]|uniref:Uncharacterized protein n=1 Tax=Lupinus luteus TaxID=3873 RepID=A0AAV1WKG5_LUPLU
MVQQKETIFDDVVLHLYELHWVALSATWWEKEGKDPSTFQSCRLNLIKEYELIRSVIFNYAQNPRI